MKDALFFSEVEEEPENSVIIGEVAFEEIPDLIKLSLVDWLVEVARL